MIDRISNCRILGEIGSGGMAVIYKAVQEPLERLVAIKALKPSIALDSHFAVRFEREARFMASLQHENIIHVHDLIKNGSSMYIIMEYVRGIDLYDLLERASHVPAEIAAIIGLQVARALDYAHFRGLIHRDIKPANIIISYQGEVKLMDFGIARDESTGRDLTETGTGVGTPSYMSPEQILGDNLDFRSDIFSLGIVLYQLVAGSKPFVEDGARSVMQKIRLDRYTAPHRLVSTVPRSLERILARCMEKSPANRYPTTQALIDDLMEFLTARVPINHNARLVMYLRDLGVVEREEAEQTLMKGAARSARSANRNHGLMQRAWLVNGSLFLAMVLSGGYLQISNGRFSQESLAYAEQLEAERQPFRRGFLKVVVDPWADVYIDGQLAATTPTASPIALTPGKHYINFKNPYYIEEKTHVVIRLNKTEIIEVRLREQDPAASRSTKASAL
ncbi:MAG: serine/threonine protein kinase [Deltaproteobacteria bacterium]|nr:serine/threonine protein kinase [Deltaproteobacteria bacterium]